MNTGARQATYVNSDFTESEATAKVGKQVYLLADHGQLHAGANGNIVDFHQTPDARLQVVIRWNSINGAEPVYEGFNKNRYQRFVCER